MQGKRTTSDIVHQTGCIPFTDVQQPNKRNLLNCTAEPILRYQIFWPPLYTWIGLMGREDSEQNGAKCRMKHTSDPDRT